MWIEGLGRVFNVIPIAAGRAISMVDAPAITFVTTGNDTFTLTCSDTFAGTYNNTGIATLAGLVNVYKSSATNGTAAWVKDNTLITNNTIVSGGAIAVAFTIGDTVIPDNKSYVKLTAAGGGLVTAILHDLSVQRGPANLAIPSA
jgi:hypothetical protein